VDCSGMSVARFPFLITRKLAQQFLHCTMNCLEKYNGPQSVNQGNGEFIIWMLAFTIPALAGLLGVLAPG